MTREDAYKLNTHKSGKLQDIRWREAVDKIFDAFDKTEEKLIDCMEKYTDLEMKLTRTCESCKYCCVDDIDDKTLMCNQEFRIKNYYDDIPIDGYIQVGKDWYCADWERKE